MIIRKYRFVSYLISNSEVLLGTRYVWNNIYIYIYVQYNDGVFNECKISDRGSDDDIASINSKDADDDDD